MVCFNLLMKAFLFSSISAIAVRDKSSTDSCVNLCNAGERQGGTFKKVFSHNSKFGFFENSKDALNKNADDETQPLFSILGSLEQFRNSERQLHFKLVYPEIPATNEWVQTSNPAKDETITGFEAINLDISIRSDDDAWEGLGYSNEKSLIDDMPEGKFWWTAIGAYQAYPADSETFPGLKKNKVSKVDLYVMVPSSGSFSFSSSSSSTSVTYVTSVSSVSYTSTVPKAATERGMKYQVPGGSCANTFRQMADCVSQCDGGVKPSPTFRKVFYHNSKYGFFANKKDALKKNADDETQPLYSILGDLEDFRNSDGKFHFKLVYPEISATNEWIQSSNPATDTTITGFEAISLDVDINSYDEAWAGLGYSDDKTLIDDAPDGIRWWTAIGSYQEYPKEPGTFPGLKKNAVSIVELYVYVD